MSERDELKTFADAWRGLDGDSGLTVQAALRRQARHNTVLLLDVLGVGLLLAFALFFWLLGGGLVLRAASAVFAGTAVLSGMLIARKRAKLGGWADWTPQGVLAFRIRECELALLNARWQLVGCAVVVVFAAFVWLAAELAWDALPPGFHYFYAAVVAVTATVVSAWALRRIRSKRAERERLRALLDELRDPGDPPHAPS